MLVRMFVEIGITEEQHKWIKKWAKKKGVRMPRAYKELIEKGLMSEEDAMASDGELERYNRELSGTHFG